MDNFAEQLVKRSETSADKAKRLILIIVGVFFTVVIAGLAVLQLTKPIFAMLGLILAAAAGYGTYFALQGSYVEYEYTFTNGELDVDKIVAKKKRTAMVSTDIKKFTAFGKYTDGMDESEDMTVVIASDNIASHEYYADFQHEEYGLTRLIFAPDERILDNIKKSLPPQLKRELNI